MSNVQQLINQYNQLAQRVSALISQRQEAARRERTYRKRLSELQDILRSVNGKLVSCSDDAKDRQVRTRNRISDGIRRERNAAQIMSDIEAGFESAFTSDPDGSSIKGLVSAEIAECQRQIEEAQADQRRASSQESSARSRMTSLKGSINHAAKAEGTTVTWA